MPDVDPTAAPPSRFRTAILLAGPAIYAVILLLAPAALPREARHVLALTGWLALWWLLEPVPLVATSLLPLVMLPLGGAATMREAAAPYANDLIFLFLAGFLLAAALEHWNAHARIAYALVATVGSSARRIVLGVMLATGFLSMWISNTATAAMMYPIALAVGALFGEARDAANLRTALMLGVAYAASIGGMGTLLGTPPNLILAGAARELLGREVGFLDFMAVGVPMVLVLLPLCWAMLVFVLFRGNPSLGDGARALLRERRAALGPLRGAEAGTLAVFACTAIGWVLREPKAFGSVQVPGLVALAPRLTDAAIGVAGAILLFIITARGRDGRRRPLLTWQEARGIPWDVLLLFGGGLSMAAAMESTGLAAWIGGSMSGLAGLPPVAIFAGLACVVLVLSELASNTAVATMAMPIAVSLAQAVGQPPLVLMTIAALAASTGFALPIATPPNAIVFGSGQVTVRQMARAGLLLDLLAVVAIVLLGLLIVPRVFGG
jgi:sodium-dependent dicarboxylate transporter 2/3/5